jgi:hypothetical protein
MTLKEKFRPHAKFWDCYNDEPLKYDHENKCVKIADEFATGFADWIRVCKLKGRPYDFENIKELL